ncbi:MAG: efflux RND transporter periplasmic adaptor subunit [Desulfarculus sp.]|nr:efflux RND transporter periplasmic adaptor subunit [Desulfarculus sp.]
MKTMIANLSRRWLHGGLALLLVVAGVAGFVILTKSRAPLVAKPPRDHRPLVRAVAAEVSPLAVVVHGEGTVRPLYESTLASEVAGRVVKVSPALVNGGSFAQGEVLLVVDQADYRLAVTTAKAEVHDADTKLQLAQAEAVVAREEWRRLGRTGDPPDLVAKGPQLEVAQARLASAKANLARAELNLERTEIRAPFAGRVSAKAADLGQYLKAGDKVATVYATQAVEIVTPLEDADLAWLKVPGLTSADGQGSPAEVATEFAGRQMTWKGRVVRAEGKVDERTRLVPVVVRVENPYTTRPPLAVGTYVRVSLRGKELPEATLLPRAALRADDQVWVVDDQGRISFRKVRVARIQEEKVLISDGLAPGDRVVTTQLKAVTEGMLVRLEGSEEGPRPALDQDRRPAEEKAS